MVVGDVFISRKSSKTYENTVRSLKFMPSFTFSKAIQSAGFKSLLDGFPDLNNIT